MKFLPCHMVNKAAQKKKEREKNDFREISGKKIRYD